MMKKMILLFAVFCMSLTSYAQEGNSDPEGEESNCTPLTTIEQKEMTGVFEIEFSNIEETDQGIASVYNFSCYGKRKKKRCKRSGGLCAKGKMKVTEEGEIWDVMVASPETDFTVYEPANLSDCGTEISFE